MGHHLLLRRTAVALLGAAAILIGAGCSAPEGENAVVRGSGAEAPELALQVEDGGDPHEGQTCVSCHDGPVPEDRDLPLATREGCTAAGCHQEAGPRIVEIAGIAAFPHRDHPTPWGDEDDLLTCSACHGHPTGEAPLRADTDACGLCHAEALDGSPTEECLDCHTEPDHVPVTNQGLPVPHAEVPWLQAGCVRCHYEVLEEVALDGDVPCASCHEEDIRQDLARLVPLVPDTTDPLASVEGGTHTIHAEVPCSSCHQEVAHQVVAQSSAVYLDCASCHAPAHWLPAGEIPASGVCVSCHLDVHQAVQGLFVGLVPWDSTTVRPSVKFAAGLACAECHAAAAPSAGGSMAGAAEAAGPAGSPTPSALAQVPEHGEAVGNDPESCVGCHRAEYTTVLDWWEEGGDVRLERARAYVTRAGQALGPGAVGEATRRVEFVDSGGFPHAPWLADRLLREALAATVQAYRSDGRVVPRVPELGPAPREGFCSYCHLEPADTWDLEAMPADFHRDVMTREEGG